MKFCFFGNISAALKGQTIGGGELQIALLAKALAQNGHEVVIIDPSSNENFVTIEGVKLISIPNWNKGLRGFRLFFHRIPALWKSFSIQNADYYYVRMRSYLHLIPYLVAKRIGRKFIQAVACDLDVLSFSTKFKYEYKLNFNLFRLLTVSLPNDLVFSYLQKRSDFVVLQHSGQDIDHFTTNGKKVIFPNIFSSSNLPIVDQPSKDYFIYVGALTSLKGADKLYQLFKDLDQKPSIVIVGEPRDKKSKAIIEKMHTAENIILKGRLKHEEVLHLIANAKALINTSRYEGFPNVFLEAWALGVPVISLTVNPGNVINEYKLGVCCEGDLKKMKAYMESTETSCIDKNRLTSYVMQYHDFTIAGAKFLKILKTTA